MVALIFIKVSLIVNLYMSINKIEIGDCFTCTTDKGKVIGFILLENEKGSSNDNILNFGVVYFKENKASDINEFKNGELFTHKVYTGLKGDFVTGVYAYSFNIKDVEFLNKFKHIGNIKFNSSKFRIGSGSSYTDEFFFNARFNNIEVIAGPKFERQTLINVLN
ncbi:MAG: hypothetical protein ACK5QC_00690 [Bacteroidota bacterium]|jgi:hypothetical protein